MFSHIALKVIKEDEVSFKVTKTETLEDIFFYTYLPDYKLSIQRWLGSLEDEEIIFIYHQIGLFAKENKHFITASISDLLETKNSFHFTNEWVAKEFIPQSIKWGYRYAFFVKPKEFFAQLALEDAIDELLSIEGLNEVKVFETLDNAQNYAVSILE